MQLCCRQQAAMRPCLLAIAFFCDVCCWCQAIPTTSFMRLLCLRQVAMRPCLFVIDCCDVFRGAKLCQQALCDYSACRQQAAQLDAVRPCLFAIGFCDACCWCEALSTSFWRRFCRQQAAQHNAIQPCLLAIGVCDAYCWCEALPTRFMRLLCRQRLGNLTLRDPASSRLAFVMRTVGAKFYQQALCAGSAGNRLRNMTVCDSAY